MSDDGDGPTLREFRNDIGTIVGEEGRVSAALILLQLAVIGLIMFGGEGLRYIGCKLTGREYRAPTHRILEDSEVDQ